MKRTEPQFTLPGEIEHCLSVLSKIYAQDGARQKLEIIVNARIRVHEAWTYDNWDGATYGHALHFTLPEALFVNTIKNRDVLQSEIAADINKIHNARNEHIAEVFFEMERADDRDWRRESGVLSLQNRIVLPDTTTRIWGDAKFRLFLSHKTEIKVKAAELKLLLEPYGVSCFVAHEDIHPTKEWQDEIEAALSTMDGFAALMSEGFHDSFWTDQEVGFAVGRGVPIIALRMGRDPYGFIGKFQGLTCEWGDSPFEIVKLLIKESRMVDAYIAAMNSCYSFYTGNNLARLLPDIQNISEEQARAMVAAYNGNQEIRGSFGFNGNKPRQYGEGLAAHILRITGQKFM